MKTESSLYVKADMINGLLLQADSNLLDEIGDKLSDMQIYDLKYKYKSLQQLILPALELSNQLLEQLEK